ncbi:2-polyprenyl-3-methyl-5-hydroxy-6-metoxy-1,4-benzoquinol methylase [Paenibacillaceae bacterium GAS479]|nr:2-polyprenyl-3-methyl-5-hydroxy-6-metoxy-1,4-benzoquinol methylase [Paenibacillaceae bacterium GAS479]
MKYDVTVDLAKKSSHSIILSQVSRGKKVLEFGPASGYMTKYMKERLNCRITAVELDPLAARLAEKYSDKMIVANIDNEEEWLLEVSKETYDFILFADVLEHLRNPFEVLRKVAEILEPNGSIIFSVPNVSHNSIIMDLMMGKFDYRSEGLLDSTHIHFFTRKTILGMLEYTDLKVLDWNVTQRRPETTEFKQDYRNFPRDVGKFLEDREDGHIYQHIVTVQKGGFLNSSPDALRRLPENYLDSPYFQVYWGNEGFFDELKSTRVPIDLNRSQLISYSVVLPGNIQGKLRLDLANVPVLGEIERIQVESRDSEKRYYCWDAAAYQKSDFKCENLILEPFQGKLYFVSANDDPSLILNHFTLDPDEDGFKISIEMKLNGSINGIINFLSQRVLRLEEECKELKEQNNVLISKSSIDDKLTQMLTTLETHQKHTDELFLKINNGSEQLHDDIDQGFKNMTSSLNATKALELELSTSLVEVINKLDEIKSSVERSILKKFFYRDR